MFILKLVALYDAIKVTLGAFPATEADISQLIADIETSVLTKPWTLAALEQALADAKQILTDFAAERAAGGGKAIGALIAQIKALFA